MTQIAKMPIPYVEIRSLVLEALRQRHETQFLSLCYLVAELAVRKSVVPNPHQGRVVSGDTFAPTNDDQEIIREIIWDLIIERVVTIGINSSNTEWPFLRLTSYGLQVIASEMPIPHDPSGYMEYLRAQIPNLDSVAAIYLQEAISSYNVGSILASMVMLGCASEKSLLLLVESFTKALPTDEARDRFNQRVEGRLIKRQFDEFSKALTTYISQLPKDLSDNLTVILLGTFEIIRNVRNEAGHPTGKTISRTQAFALLQVFIEYCKRVHALCDFMNSNRFSVIVQPFLGFFCD